MDADLNQSGNPEVVLRFENVSKRYRSGDFWRPIQALALDGVSFELRAGEVFGLVGLNGAGKTTLMKSAVGLLRPSAGKITILGMEPSRVEARQRFGYLPELPSFPGYLSAIEVLRYYGRLYGLGGASLYKKVDQVLDLVGLAKRGSAPLREYSKGMQQRVGLAQTLLHDPELLFLDEPMTGLDPRGIKEMRDIILALKFAGKTLFFNSHILGEVEKICDRVGLLHRGQMKLVSSVAALVAGHQSTIVLGLELPELRVRKALRDLGLSLKEENHLWTLRIPNDQLRQTLISLEKLQVPTPAILSYGSPLESAFLEQTGGSDE